MKRSSVVIIAILIFLVGISIYVYKSKSRTSTLTEEVRDFGVKDTASITKIFLADKEGDRSTIERTKTGWVVNGKYSCRSEAILNLLEVIKHVEVKNPVPQQAKEGIIKFMASTSIKVEIYAGDELIKQYYVGRETLDSQGSYMLLTDISTGKNYPDPFVCFIPGFQGFLQPRYIAKENEWRDRIVLNYIPPQIKQIKLQHFEAPADSSFTIDLLSTTAFTLKDHKGADLAFDMNRMKQYLAYFQNISYEVLITGMNKKLQDSLAQQKPFSILTITTTDFRTNTYKFFHKQYSGEVNPELGIVYKYDPDRLFMRFDKDNEWALIQYFVFGKLFVTPSYFSPPASVKK